MNRAILRDQRMMLFAAVADHARVLAQLPRVVLLRRVHAPVRHPAVRVERDSRKLVFHPVQNVRDDLLRLLDRCACGRGEDTLEEDIHAFADRGHMTCISYDIKVINISLLWGPEIAPAALKISDERSVGTLRAKAAQPV